MKLNIQALLHAIESERIDSSILSQVEQCLTVVQSFASVQPHLLDCLSMDEAFEVLRTGLHKHDRKSLDGWLRAEYSFLAPGAKYEARDAIRDYLRSMSTLEDLELALSRGWPSIREEALSLRKAGGVA